MSVLKLNWGGRIAILYMGFVVLIVILVAGSMRESVDLVSADYYQKELQYQDVIDAGKNQASLSSAVNVTTSADDVIIQFPPEFRSSVIKGSVQFYSPVNPAWDVTETIAASEGICVIKRNKLTNTRYKVKMSWEVDSKMYYQETDVNLH